MSPDEMLLDPLRETMRESDEPRPEKPGIAPIPVFPARPAAAPHGASPSMPPPAAVPPVRTIVVDRAPEPVLPPRQREALRAADAAVVPSLYEPFGIVALEAAATSTPLVVSETGGLQDLVDAGVVAASFPPRDVRALTEAVDATLADPAAARRAAARATRLIRRDYTWAAVAARTADVYVEAAAKL